MQRIKGEYKAEVGTATTYHFRWTETYSGWAIFTVNDMTGELNIQSDWGNWAYRWGACGLGGDRTLTQFLTTVSPGYVVDKLSYDQPREFRECLSARLTESEWRKLLLRQRMAVCSAKARDWLARMFGFRSIPCYEPIGRDEAREIWDQIGEFFGDHDIDTEASAIHAINQLAEYQTELYDWLGGCEHEVWGQIRSEPSYEYKFLLNELLPFFFTYLRDHAPKGKPDVG